MVKIPGTVDDVTVTRGPVTGRHPSIATATMTVTADLVEGRVPETATVTVVTVTATWTVTAEAGTEVTETTGAREGSRKRKDRDHVRVTGVTGSGVGVTGGTETIRRTEVRRLLQLLRRSHRSARAKRGKAQNRRRHLPPTRTKNVIMLEGN